MSPLISCDLHDMEKINLKRKPSCKRDAIMDKAPNPYVVRHGSYRTYPGGGPFRRGMSNTFPIGKRRHGSDAPNRGFSKAELPEDTDGLVLLFPSMIYRSDRIPQPYTFEGTCL